MVAFPSARLLRSPRPQRSKMFSMLQDETYLTVQKFGQIIQSEGELFPYLYHNRTEQHAFRNLELMRSSGWNIHDISSGNFLHMPVLNT